MAVPSCGDCVIVRRLGERYKWFCHRELQEATLVDRPGYSRTAISLVGVGKIGARLLCLSDRLGRIHFRDSTVARIPVGISKLRSLMWLFSNSLGPESGPFTTPVAIHCLL
jgi:hypothetical protein